MSLFALSINEPFGLLLAGMLFLVFASVIQLRLLRKEKAETPEAE